MRLMLVVLACVLFVLEEAKTDQTDPRLDTLFAALEGASNTADARLIEQRIWNVWAEIDDPDSALLLEQGNAAMASRLYDVAMTRYDELIEREPAFAEAWNRRATLHFIRGDFRASVLDIQKTLDLEPRHFGALSGLGLIYMSLEENEAAIRSFEAALDIYPFMSGPRANIERLKGEIEGSRT